MELKHPVIDSDTSFIIDGATRLVKNDTETKSMLVQYDHNSERFTFRVPRKVDGHDLSMCDTVRVHFINIDKTKRMEESGVSNITDTLGVCPEDDEYVICSWLIPDDATQYAGFLHFVIQFACTNGDETLYSWNTAKYTGVTVADGINGGKAIVDKSIDLLKEWENQLKANQIVKLEQTQVTSLDDGENIWTATFGDGRTQDLKVRNGSRGSTGLVGSIQTIQGNTLHFFVGTKAEYEALTDEQKVNVFAIITDDPTIDEIIDLKLAPLIIETVDTGGRLCAFDTLKPNRLYAISIETRTTAGVDVDERETVMLYVVPDTSKIRSSQSFSGMSCRCEFVNDSWWIDFFVGTSRQFKSATIREI